MHLYVFLDESGNFDFSSSGTTYFTFTAVTKSRPWAIGPELENLKWDLMERGQEFEKFHATDDPTAVREKVFQVIERHRERLRVDSLIVEKRKTGPALRADARFYPEMLGYLLRWVLTGVNYAKVSEVIVVTDRIPVNKKRRAIEKAVKMALRDMLSARLPYRIYHHNSASAFGLQVADYCCWAIHRKWSGKGRRYYDIIEPQIASEFDIFRTGTTYYY